MRTRTYAPAAYSASDAFKLLSASLLMAGLGKTFKTLAITSSGPGEGKSVVTANLAAALAQSERRVVIVDANFRNPCQHHIWQINNIEENSSVPKEAVNGSIPGAKDTGIKNLLLVPSGFYNLASGTNRTFQEIDLWIDEIKKQADIVLFDTSSVFASSDTPLLAGKTDGALLVVGAGMYKKEIVREAAYLLRSLHVSIVGTVLNRVEIPHVFKVGG